MLEKVQNFFNFIHIENIVTNKLSWYNIPNSDLGGYKSYDGIYQ